MSNRGKKQPVPAEECCRCDCRARCPEPDCNYTCLGGHHFSPLHWCPEQDHAMWSDQ